MHIIGKIDKNIYKCITDDIRTNKVIITGERIKHIKARHPDDYRKYCRYIRQMIEQPDYIVETSKPNTAFVLKSFGSQHEGYQLILRIKTSSDPKGYKNSIITFFKIEDKKWNKYLNKKKILYSSQTELLKIEGLCNFAAASLQTQYENKC